MKRTCAAYIAAILSYLVLAAGSGELRAEETDYSLYPHLEPEITLENYGIDLVNFDWGREWNLLWEQSDNGIRTGGASISNPSLLWLVEVKARQRLTSRIHFGYHYRQSRKYSYRDEEVGDFEIEYRVKDNYFASITGRPFFYKPDADFGLKFKYHMSNSNYLHLEYVWADAFTNFIHGRIEDEPIDREYHLRKPAEYRLAYAYTAGRYLLRAGVKIRPESATLVTFYQAGDDNYARRLAHGEAGLTFEFTPVTAATIGLQVAGDETRDKKEFVPAAAARNFAAWQKEYSVYLYHVRRLSQAVELNVGGIYQGQEYILAFPHNAAEDYGYVRQNINPVALLRFDHSTRGWILGTGYLADDMNAKRNYPNNASRNTAIRNEEQRLLLSAEHLFTPSTRIRVLLGLDIDDWKALIPYDHGGIFFSTSW